MTFEPLTSERRRQQTRDYLLQAAAQVFAERGFHAASLDQVAAAAGFTKGAVYSNFKSKEDLFLALLEGAYTREAALVRETMDASEVPPEDRLGDFASLVRTEYGESPDLSGLYLEFALYARRNPEARDRLAALDDDDVRAIAEIIEGSRSTREDQLGPASAETAARLVIALFRGIGVLRLIDPTAVDSTLLEEAVAFVARGLGVDV
jgi:AcrR family transcriptional regulator